MMQQYSIYETKAKLSELIHRVKKGVEIIVTERGSPVIKMVPLTPKENDYETRLRQLAKEGVIDLPRRQTKKWASGVSKPGALARFLKDR